MSASVCKCAVIPYNIVYPFNASTSLPWAFYWTRPPCWAHNGALCVAKKELVRLGWETDSQSSKQLKGKAMKSDDSGFDFFWGGMLWAMHMWTPCSSLLFPQSVKKQQDLLQSRRRANPRSFSMLACRCVTAWHGPLPRSARDQLQGHSAHVSPHLPPFPPHFPHFPSFPPTHPIFHQKFSGKM